MLSETQNANKYYETAVIISVRIIQESDLSRVRDSKVRLYFKINIFSGVLLDTDNWIW